MKRRVSLLFVTLILPIAGVLPISGCGGTDTVSTPDQSERDKLAEMIEADEKAAEERALAKGLSLDD